MKTRGARPAEDVPEAPPDTRADFGGRSWLFSLGLAGATAAVVLTFFLSIYPVRHFEVPMGWDSMDYVWRTRVSQEFGLSEIRQGVPPRTFVKEGRPGYLILASTLSSLSGSSVLMVAFILPLVMPVAMGLAAGVFLRAHAGLPWWGLPLGAVVAGTSLNAILMIQYGYVDNLIVSAVVMAATVPILASVEDGRFVLPSVVLLLAAGVIELPFFWVTLLAVALTALALLPGSWRQWRGGGARLIDTPSVRLGQVVGGSGLAAWAAVYLLANNAPAPRLHRGELAKKLTADVPRYRLQLMLPWAGLGAVTMGVSSRAGEPGEGRRRLALLFLLAWVAVAAVAWAAFEVTSLPVPANRLILFALAVPVLVALGIAGVGSVLASVAGPRLARWLPVAVVVLAMAGVGWVSAREWRTGPSYLDPAKIRDAAAAEAYLSAVGVPADRPVVFVVDDRGPNPVAVTSLMRDHIYAVLPVDRIDRVWVYLGSPEDFLAQRPTEVPGNRQFGRASEQFFSRMKHVYAEDPVALIVSSYNVSHFPRWAAEHPETVVFGYGVAVVQGPPAPPAISPEPVPAKEPGIVRLGLLAGHALAVVGLVGLGWVLWIFRGRLEPAEALSMAPAVGVAAVVLAGLLADRLGVRLSGPGAVLTPVVAGALGWAGYLLADRTRGSLLQR